MPTGSPLSHGTASLPQRRLRLVIGVILGAVLGYLVGWWIAS